MCNYRFAVLTLTLAMLMAGCGGKDAAPPVPVEPIPSPKAAEPAPTPVEAPAAVVSDPLQQKLIGTSWKLSDFEITFKDANKIWLKGGPLRDLAPAGLDAQYTYKDGTVEIVAMGQTKTGTWDGEQLMIEGLAATKL